MKNTMCWICALFLINSLSSFAQTRPTLTFDPISGDYVLKYQFNDQVIEKFFVPATKVDPTLNVRVSSSAETARYSYTLSNGHAGRQRLLSFRIKVPDNLILQVLSPNSQWRSRPAGVISGWYWGHTLVDSTGAATAYNGIPPDSVVEGFSLLSMGLPTLTLAYFQGFTGAMNFESEPPAEVHEILKPLESFPANYVSRKTIGPSYAPSPNPFIHLAFLDTIISYTRQSAELGWLGRDRDNDCDSDERPEDGIVRNIEKRLNKAKRELERRDSVLARRELEKLVAKVERLWKRSEDNEEGKHGKDRKNWWRRDKDDRVVITSEAYALLKFNTEYLIDRLLDESSRRPDRKPKKGSKDRD
mgnify:CR=1 FL=1